MPLDFLITSLIVIVSPGTGALYTLAAGLGGGPRASVIAAFGCTLGIVPHMLAALTGVAAVFHSSRLAFEILRAAGVAYLLYMAWKTLQEDGPLRIASSGGAARPAGEVIRTAMLVNLLNPKLSIFFLAFLPQFVPTGTAEPLARMLMLSGVFMALTFVVFVGYGLLASSLRTLLLRATVLQWMRRVFALAFAVLGLKLALG